MVAGVVPLPLLQSKPISVCFCYSFAGPLPSCRCGGNASDFFLPTIISTHTQDGFNSRPSADKNLRLTSSRLLLFSQWTLEETYCRCHQREQAFRKVVMFIFTLYRTSPSTSIIICNLLPHPTFTHQRVWPLSFSSVRPHKTTSVKGQTPLLSDPIIYNFCVIFSACFVGNENDSDRDGNDDDICCSRLKIIFFPLPVIFCCVVIAFQEVYEIILK